MKQGEVCRLHQWRSYWTWTFQRVIGNSKKQFLEAIENYCTSDYPPVSWLFPLASRFGSTSHVITSVSSLSHLKSSSYPASSSNSCSRGLTEAGITSATNLLTSLGEAGAFPPPVILASWWCKSCSFFECSFSHLQHQLKLTEVTFDTVRILGVKFS